MAMAMAWIMAMAGLMATRTQDPVIYRVFVRMVIQSALLPATIVTIYIQSYLFLVKLDTTKCETILFSILSYVILGTLDRFEVRLKTTLPWKYT